MGDYSSGTPRPPGTGRGPELYAEPSGQRPSGYTPLHTLSAHKAITSVTAQARAIGQKCRRVYDVVGQSDGDLQVSPGGSRPTPRTHERRLTSGRAWRRAEGTGAEAFSR